MRPSTTITARTAIVVLSPLDKALVSPRLVHRSKCSDRPRNAVGYARAHLIEQRAIRQADARNFNRYRRSADRAQLPHRRLDRRLRRAMEALRHLDLD